MDISDYLLTPLLPSKREGALADIGSVAYDKREAQRRSEARETVYMEEGAYQVTWLNEEETKAMWERYWAGGEKGVKE